MNDLEIAWSLLARDDKLRYFAIRSPRTLAGVANALTKLFHVVTINPDFNWYATLNPTRARASLKARSSDVIEWAWILLDVDPMTPDADPEACMNFILDTHQIREYCAVLDSGRGRQAWVSVRPMSLSGDIIRGQIERSTSAWLRSLDPARFGCRVDTSCSDLCRVARLPGTVNHRTGRTATFMSLPSEQLDPQEILKYYPGEAETGQQRHAQVGSESASLASILPYLTETAAHFLTEGATAPGRHSACYATARSLCEAGVPIERASVWLLAGGAICNPILPIRDILRALRTAYEKGPS